MKLKKVLSALCSVTCAWCSANAQPGDMKSKIAKMREKTNREASKSLVTAGNRARNFFWPGNYSEDGEKILKARGVQSLLNDETYSDVVKILENLDKDPEAKKKILELANNYEAKSWVKYCVRSHLMVTWIGMGLFELFSLYKLATSMVKLAKDVGIGDECNDHIMIFGKKRIKNWSIAFAVCLIVHLAESVGISALNRSSFKDYGIKEALNKLVIESEGIRAVNQQFQNRAISGAVNNNPTMKSSKLIPDAVTKNKKFLDKRRRKRVRNNKATFNNIRVDVPNQE